MEIAYLVHHMKVIGPFAEKIIGREPAKQEASDVLESC